MPHRRFLCLTVLSVLGGVLLVAQVPQAPPPLTQPPPAAPSSPPAPGGLRDPAELEHFLDGVVAAQKESNHVEGMTVAVVGCRISSSTSRRLRSSGWGPSSRQ